MKTALQHFNELPSPYGQMAIEETIRQGCERLLKDEYESVRGALISSFTWKKSETGWDFWDGIYCSIIHLESQSKQDKG